MRVGRVSLHRHLYALNRPRLWLCVEGDGRDPRSICELVVDYGTPGADPVVMLAVDLAGTRAGRILADIYWTVYGTASKLRPRRPPRKDLTMLNPEYAIARMRDLVDEYEPSRERSLALTKLDEFELWLSRCTPSQEALDRDTAAGG